MIAHFSFEMPDGVSFGPDGVSFCPEYHPQPILAFGDMYVYKTPSVTA